MYKKIMVAIDGSHVSVLALKEALHLAKSLRSKLCIIHVLDNLYEGDVDPEEMRVLRQKQGEGILNDMKLIVDSSNIEFELKLAEIELPQVRIAEQLIKEANIWGADLIVVGTHGRRGFNHLLLGSVAESIIRIAQSPVLLVRGMN